MHVLMAFKKLQDINQNQLMLKFIRIWYNNLQFGLEVVSSDQTIALRWYATAKQNMRKKVPEFVDTMLSLEVDSELAINQ